MPELYKSRICNVLLAEDDEDDFHFFNIAISSLDGMYQLLRISDGVMFSSLIQTSIDPDIIFLDINMPYKDGIACLKEIRSHEGYNSIKVVMYSTSNNVKEIDRCYSMGADFYLIKPPCYLCIQQQLMELFQNDYFVKNIKPPREEFVFHSAKFHTKEGNYHFNHRPAFA